MIFSVINFYAHRLITNRKAFLSLEGVTTSVRLRKNITWNLDNEWNRLWGNIAEVRSQRYHKKTNSINLPEITGTQKTNLRIRKIPWVWPKPSAYMFVCIRCYICYSLLCNLGLSLTHLPDTGILVLQLVWLGPSLVWGDLASLTVTWYAIWRWYCRRLAFFMKGNSRKVYLGREKGRTWKRGCSGSCGLDVI